MALKSARTADLCGKLSGFADFENTVDCGSGVIFDVDSGLCLSLCSDLGSYTNLDHRSFFSLDRYVNEFIQIISFLKRSSFNLRCTYIHTFTVNDLGITISHDLSWALHVVEVVNKANRVLGLIKRTIGSGIVL